MKSIIVQYDEPTGNVNLPDGTYIGVLAPGTPIVEATSAGGELTLQLVKQGVTVDEIIKLKNAELI